MLGEVATLGEGQRRGHVVLQFLPLEFGVRQGLLGLRQLLLDMQGVSPKGQLGALLWVLPARGHCGLFHQVVIIFAHAPWQGLWLGGAAAGGYDSPWPAAAADRSSARPGSAVCNSPGEMSPVRSAGSSVVCHGNHTFLEKTA